MGAHYFLGNQLLGSSTSDFPYSQSCALFCTTCGDVWGRIATGGPWRVRSVPCIKHQPTGVVDWGTVPGSFLIASLTKEHTSVMFAAETLEALPPEVLRRELDIHLAKGPP